MNLQKNVLLAPYTSFNVGGPAEYFAIVKNSEDLLEALKCTLPDTTLWLLGYGSNSLISDKGLSGMTLCIRGGSIVIDDDGLVIADAGAWWDDVVQESITSNLWGLELLSEIPGSVGAAAYINIAAYGQSVGNCIEWIEVWDRKENNVRSISADNLTWDYKQSIFQDTKNAQLVILRVAFRLSKTKTTEVTYQKAIDVAEELNLDIDNLTDRRTMIIEARNRAGSLWQPKTGQVNHTVGSFFRNPIVTNEQVDALLAYEEFGQSANDIRAMNKSHGGDETRVSAAHVLLAAGFSRGQTWGSVKLNDKNLLKIEALPGAKAQDIYQVAQEIIATCMEKLGIKLEPEARILGIFD